MEPCPSRATLSLPPCSLKRDDLRYNRRDGALSIDESKTFREHSPLCDRIFRGRITIADPIYFRSYRVLISDVKIREICCARRIVVQSSVNVISRKIDSARGLRRSASYDLPSDFSASRDYYTIGEYIARPYVLPMANRRVADGEIAETIYSAVSSRKWLPIVALSPPLPLHLSRSIYRLRAR